MQHHLRNKDAAPHRDLVQGDLIAIWYGDRSRRGMQFETITFAPGGILEAHIVTMCVRGFCPSIESNGTFAIIEDNRLVLTLDGVGQEFESWFLDGALILREPVGGLSKRYSRANLPVEAPSVGL